MKPWLRKLLLVVLILAVGSVGAWGVWWQHKHFQWHQERGW